MKQNQSINQKKLPESGNESKSKITKKLTEEKLSKVLKKSPIAKDYFNGKSHKFNVTETQARSNSNFINKLAKEINEKNKSEKLQKLTTKIKKQYNEIAGENIDLTENQLLTILDAHKQEGILGQLTDSQLRKKVKILSETVKDKDIRRFLLEAGFCGFNIFSNKKQKYKEDDYVYVCINGHRSTARIEKYNKKSKRYHAIDEYGNYVVVEEKNIKSLDDNIYKRGDTVYLENIGIIGEIKRFNTETKKYKVQGEDGITYIVDESEISPIHNVEFDDEEGEENTIDNDYDEEIDIPIVNVDEEDEDIPIIFINDEENSDEIKITLNEISREDLNMLKNLKRGKKENIYLETFGGPKHVVNLGNGENLYVTDVISGVSRPCIVGYVKKGNQIKLRLFYRSSSEGLRRSCPGYVKWKDKETGKIRTTFSKGEDIPNSSYETTTMISNEIGAIFDQLPNIYDNKNPILDMNVGQNILSNEMENEIKIDKLFNNSANSTVNYIKNKNSYDVKNMYKHLGENFNLNEMKFLEGMGYTYKHKYLGNIKVQICRLKYKNNKIDFHFARTENEPEKVRIEEVRYADAKLTSFGIYDKQINATPLTGKPIDYKKQVPKDMKNNENIEGSSYIDIRDLYQENPLIKRFKKESKRHQQ